MPVTFADFPVAGYYWIQRIGRLPEIIKVFAIDPVNDDASVRCNGMAGAYRLRPLLASNELQRAKLIDPGTDPFAPEFSLTVRRGAVTLLSGRISVSSGDASTLAEMERQANAAGGPLRIWINDASTLDGQGAAFLGRLFTDSHSVESSPGVLRTRDPADASGDEFEIA